MRNLTTALAVILAFTAPVNAKPVNVLTPSEQLLAGEMAHWRGIAQLCRQSDAENDQGKDPD